MGCKGHRVCLQDKSDQVRDPLESFFVDKELSLQFI